MSNAKSHIAGNWNHYLIIAVFFFVLLLPLIQTYFPVVHYSKIVRQFNEKRALAPLPEFALNSIEHYPEQLNQYVNDNFELRKYLIAWNNYWKVKTFKVSPVETVTLGKDDWMYFSAKGVLENLAGNNLFHEEELTLIKSNLEQKQIFTQQQNAQFYLVIAPNKSSVYPEHLPFYIPVTGPSRTGQLIEYLQQNTSIKVIDMREEFRQDKKNHPLFYKADSHWNHHGAFIGYQKLITELRKDYPNLKLFEREHFTILPDTVKGGDLAESLAMVEYFDRIHYNYIPHDTLPKFTQSINEDYYTYDQSYKATMIAISADSTAPKIMNFHDSFSYYLWNFFPLSFSRSVFLWTHEFRGDLVEKEKPDIVIYTIVERDLHYFIADQY
ncbi:MAG: hypothetical protein KDD41_08285 [Flavobacteriales bacterium]|nr:hypothetical protein [Flavobacteriales bacterium]